MGVLNGEVRHQVARERSDFQSLVSSARAERFLSQYEEGSTFRAIAQREGVTIERARQIVIRGVRSRRRSDIQRGAVVPEIDDYHAAVKARCLLARKASKKEGLSV